MCTIEHCSSAEYMRLEMLSSHAKISVTWVQGCRKWKTPIVWSTQGYTYSFPGTSLQVPGAHTHMYMYHASYYYTARYDMLYTLGVRTSRTWPGFGTRLCIESPYISQQKVTWTCILLSFEVRCDSRQLQGCLSLTQNSYTHKWLPKCTNVMPIPIASADISNYSQSVLIHIPLISPHSIVVSMLPHIRYN